MVKDPFPQHQEQHSNAHLTTYIQNYSVYSGQDNQARKRNKKETKKKEKEKKKNNNIQIRKEEVKLLLLEDDMNLYTKKS